jgi:hypothetical protein
MATFTIIVDTNYQDLVGAAGNDTFAINGAKLTIDTDTRYCTNHDGVTGNIGGPVTISPSLGGELLIDGTGVRIIPFDSGTGVVPAIGTTISQGGVSAYLLGVWASFIVAPTAEGVAMPVSGYIKVKNKTGGDFAVGALTGIGANATGVDVVGWIEVVGVEAGTCTVPRLGKFTMRGEWFTPVDAVGAEIKTSGVANQTIQLPASLANTYYPGVWIETGVGTGVYEFYPSAGTATTTRQDAAGKVVWISSQGLLRIGNSGAATNGYLPVAGCKIRVPNIITINVTSAAMGTNALPNATLGTRWEFATTGGAYIDIDKANMAWYCNFAQAFYISITNTGILEKLLISECASPIILTHVGVGQTAAQIQIAFALSLCFAGGTFNNCVWSRATLASAAYVCTMTDCFGFTINNEVIRSCVQKAIAGTGSWNLTRCNYCTFNTFKSVATGQIIMTTCSYITINNLSHCDHVSGTTVTTYVGYLATITANSNNIKIDGMDFWGLTNVHPYTGLFLISAAAADIKLRNIGTAASPLSLGSANATGYVLIGVAGAGCKNIELKRIYVVNTRTGFMNLIDNSYSGVSFVNTWTDAADTLTFLALNLIARGMKGVNAVGVQTAVYGTHWFDLFDAATTGRIGISFMEKTGEEPSASSYEIITAGAGCGFDSTGRVVMPNVGDQIIWTVQYDIIGHTGFQNVDPTKTGVNTGNFTYEYQIDKNDGNGWNGTWKTLDGATLSAETGIDAEKGIRLKIRITVATASATNALTFLTIPTNSTSTSQGYQYPLDVIQLSMTVKNEANEPIVGAFAYIDPTDVAPYIMNTTTNSSGIATVSYGGGPVNNTRWRVRKYGYKNFKQILDIGGDNISLPVVLVIDPQQT